MRVAGITVAARSDKLAGEVAALARDDSGRTTEVLSWKKMADRVEQVDLVVNATPVGMRGERLLANATFNSDQCVVDLIYSPPTTPLIEHARAAGATAWGGLGMLVRQAAASFTIWTGQQAPLDAMSAAAIRGIGHHH